MGWRRRRRSAVSRSKRQRRPSDMYAAIDLVVDRLDRRIDRTRERRREPRRSTWA
ncbi:MAG TPA: HPF/RaiA family ribosome-associated protein [Thermodesulfobacteriota bacterium]